MKSDTTSHWSRCAILWLGYWPERILLAIVFGLAGVIKLVLPRSTRAVVDTSWLTAVESPAVLLGIAIVEILCAVALLSRTWRLGVVISFVLASLFVFYRAALLWNGIVSASCGCLGTIRLPLVSQLVMLFGVLILSVLTLVPRRDQ